MLKKIKMGSGLVFCIYSMNIKYLDFIGMQNTRPDPRHRGFL